MKKIMEILFSVLNWLYMAVGIAAVKVLHLFGRKGVTEIILGVLKDKYQDMLDEDDISDQEVRAILDDLRWFWQK